MTRRELILHAARSGGYGAAFLAMRSMGLLAEPPADTESLELPPGTGKGVKVVVLGAGIAGLVSAYELRKAGFDCTVLEARERPGGRNWTIRRGDRIDLSDSAAQQCTFDPGLYFNAGPGRIPSIHRTMLGYCRELGVSMEVEVNTSRSALLESDHAFGGAPVEQREALNDARGHVAELLAKAIRRGALDEEITTEDRDRMLAFLRNFGDLRPDYSYQGSERAGVKRFAGADTVEELREPLSMRVLLDASFWQALTFEEGFDMQATMFQPVGGMDRIPYAFAKSLGNTIKYKSPVQEIRKTAQGVRIAYLDRGATRSVEASYCICTLPVSVLKNVRHDFSPRIAAAINQTDYANAYKIAWESRRFWEQDDNIYGGISWLANGPISLEAGGTLANVWYPSGGLLSPKGVLISGYGTETGEFARLGTLEAKLEASRTAVEKLHPGRGRELTKPLYVAWARVPYSLGSWMRTPPSYYEGPYQEFSAGDERIFFAGDHCSHVNTWQEGAALSAHRAIRSIVNRMRQTA